MKMYVVTTQQNRLSETVLMKGSHYMGFMEKYRKLSQNKPCYPILLSGALGLYALLHTLVYFYFINTFITLFKRQK